MSQDLIGFEISHLAQQKLLTQMCGGRINVVELFNLFLRVPNGVFFA